MKLHVRFSGLLRQRFDGGMTVELPDGARLQDLCDILGIAPSEGSIAVAGGRVLKAGSALKEGMEVNFYPLMAGG